MSPLWRNRLCAYVSPEQISLLKLGRGLKPKWLGQYDEAVQASGTQQAWQGAMARLADLLASPEWHAAEADITLSNRFVQYATVSFDRQLKTYAEREAYARHVLVQRHGSVAEQWDLRIQKGGEDMPWLVSAVDRSLLDACRRVCAERKVNLRALSPYLMAAFNRVRDSLKADPAWLVVSEPGYSLIVLLKDQEFFCVHGVAHAGAQELPMLLDRENLIAGLAEPCRMVYVFAPFEAGQPSVPSTRGYEFIQLEGAVRLDMSGSETAAPAGVLGGAM